MKFITEADFKNKNVFIRVDFNVPIKDQIILDDKRIKAALPTIKYILTNGGAIILASHLGKPKGKVDPQLSLEPVAKHLSKLLQTEVIFLSDCIGLPEIERCKNLKPGQVVLLENLRYHIEEEKGTPEFASQLAQVADIYVNDAFGAAHRPHSSISVMTQYFNEKYAGFLMQAEIENAQKVMENVVHPYVAIIGGAKVSDKILLIEKLLDKVDTLIIGGGMTYTFLKAMGNNIGKSLCETDRLTEAEKIINLAQLKAKKLLLPIDSVVTKEIENPHLSTFEVQNSEIPDDYFGVDIGTKTIDVIQSTLENAKTVLWNGPMGIFEIPAFSTGTNKVASFMANITEKGAYTLIGGGDSAAAIEKFGFSDKVSFVSTGGGALLEFMEGKPLPGIIALEQ